VDVFEVKDVVTSVALATVYHVVYWGFLRFVTTTEWRLAHKMPCLGSSTTRQRQASAKSFESGSTAKRSTRIRKILSKPVVGVRLRANSGRPRSGRPRVALRRPPSTDCSKSAFYNECDASHPVMDYTIRHSMTDRT
jgi:hypothetical protein